MWAGRAWHTIDLDRQALVARDGERMALAEPPRAREAHLSEGELMDSLDSHHLEAAVVHRGRIEGVGQRADRRRGSGEVRR